MRLENPVKAAMNPIYAHKIVEGTALRINRLFNLFNRIELETEADAPGFLQGVI